MMNPNRGQGRVSGITLNNGAGVAVAPAAAPIDTQAPVPSAPAPEPPSVQVTPPPVPLSVGAADMSIIQRAGQDAAAVKTSGKKEATIQRSVTIRVSIMERMEKVRTSSGASYNWQVNEALDAFLTAKYPDVKAEKTLYI